MKKKSAFIILLLIMIVFILFYYIPVFWGFKISFTDWNGMNSNYSYVGLDNYSKMFKDPRFVNALWITLKYIIILLLFSISLGYVSAKAIISKKKGKSRILFVSFFPYVITPVVVCVLWNQLFSNFFPFVGELLNIDFLKINLLASGSTAIYAIAFVDLWMLIPYTMLLVLSGLNSIPQDLLDYSRIEKAVGWKKFKNVELPYLLPTFGMLTTIIISYGLTHIDTIMTLTSGGPGRSTETLYYVIYKNSTGNYAYALAEGIVVAIISIIVFLVINKFTNSKNISEQSKGGSL